MLARIAQTSLPYPWDSWSYDPGAGVRPGAELRMRKASLVYQTSQDYGERVRVEYTGYGDLLLQNRFPLNLDDAAVPLDARWVEDQSREEVSFGAEASASYRLTAMHSLRIGSRYVHTVVGPNRGFRFDVAENLPTTPLPGEAQVPVVDIPAGRDNSIGIYAEDRLRLNGGRTDLFVGGRADYNDWREARGVVLPRAGVIQTLTPRLTAKYVFNTGYLRPNAAYSKSGGKFYRSPSKTIEDVNVVDRSEEVRSNDVQLAYRSDRTYVAGTLFHMDVENFISWETRLDLGYRNMGGATTRGVELESRRVLSDAWTLTGNYSFASAHLDAIPFGVDIDGRTQPLDGALTDPSRRWLNAPRHMWNLGTDVILEQGHSLNLNVRGWHQMRIVAPFTAANAGEYDTLSGGVYVDAAFLTRDVLPGFDARLTGGNLLDNTGPVGMAINNGVYRPRGRSIGLHLTKRF